MLVVVDTTCIYRILRIFTIDGLIEAPPKLWKLLSPMHVQCAGEREEHAPAGSPTPLHGTNTTAVCSAMFYTVL